MSRRLRAWLVPLLVAWAWLTTGNADAHEFRPASLQLHVDQRGEVRVAMLLPATTADGPPTAALQPVPPPHCRVVSPSRWSCGEAGLSGTLAMAGLETNPVDVLVHVRWSGGGELSTRLGPDRPSVELGRGAAVSTASQAFTSYLALGAEHILFGFDHLLFVLALLLLGGRPRDHLRTITAFTLGHALTLLLQTLHPLAVPGPWVEACIAASIVVAAAEAMRPAEGRAPAWRWALAFGLLHGLGFAGALAQLGLPPAFRFTALLSFNLGVELGQLAVVLGLLVVALVGPRQAARRERWRRGLAFAAGSVAVAWTLERVVSFWS